MVPLCDLQQQYRNLKDDIDAALQQVAADGQYILGPNVKALEKEVAAWCGAKFAAGVANGTDALHLALRALRIGPGDEVITTPFTFVATTEAIGIVGATPVFVDIDPATFEIDPAAIEPAITDRTKAILPVHLYGQPCDMDAIMEIARRRGLFVVEDCAQAIGAQWKGRQVGTFGDAGCFSFFPSKNLGCMGDGGMVVSNDEEVYRRVEMLRRHGGAVKYHHSELGLNSRLDEMQAAILRVKLPHLANWIDARRRHAYRYNELLADVPGLTCPQELTTGGLVCPGADDDHSDCCRSVYHQYTILTEERDALMQALNAAGIGNAIYYPVPLHLQEVHESLGHPRGAFPAAESAARRCLSLPMFPELTESQQDAVVNCLRSFAARRGAAGTQAVRSVA
ncbi:MAG: DegT/DnrJ/EryC1/StrS family aminotransferase [Planctomycetales bacterium]